MAGDSIWNTSRDLPPGALHATYCPACAGRGLRAAPTAREVLVNGENDGSADAGCPPVSSAKPTARRTQLVLRCLREFTERRLVSACADGAVR